MRIRTKRILLLCSLILFTFFFGLDIVPASQQNEKVEIDFFWTSGCSACAQMKIFLEDLDGEQDFQLNSYETARNRNLFLQKLEEYNVPDDRRGYVPTVFIQDNYFIGYSDEIKEAIKSILQGHELDEKDFLVGETVEVDLFGIWDIELSLEGRSILFAGVILAFLDSINVCSITVLVFLIIFSLSVGSLKRAFKIGLTFTIVIFLFYNPIYIWPLLFVVFGTYFSWTRIENVDLVVQKYKKHIKLISGIALLLIALYFALPFLG